MTSDNAGAPVDVVLMTSTKPEQLPDLSRFVESKGFDNLWLAEDYFCLGGFTSCAIALEATDRMTVGLGVVAGVVRHPAVTAMEIATLARAYPGRFIPGIGHGAPFWTKQMGLFPKTLLGTLREIITSVRRLLAGEMLTAHDGHYHFDQVSLEHPVDDVKIYAGVSGPKSLELAGEIADGTILSALTGTAAVEAARERIGLGLAKSSRGGEHALPVNVMYAVDKDRKVARDAVRSMVARYLDAAGTSGLTEPAGINDDLADMISRGGMETILTEMPDEWIDLLAVAGEPDECAEGIKKLLAAGASSVVVVPVMTDRAREQIELTATEVVPRI